MNELSIEIPGIVDGLEEDIARVQPLLLSILKRLDRIMISSIDIRRMDNGNYVVRDLNSIRLAVSRSLLSLDQIPPSTRRIRRVAAESMNSDRNRGKDNAQKESVRNGSQTRGQSRSKETTINEPRKTRQKD